MFENKPRQLFEGNDVKRLIHVITPQPMKLQRDGELQALKRECAKRQSLVQIHVEFPDVKSGMYLCDFDPFQRLLSKKTTPRKLLIEQRGTIVMPHFSDAGFVRIANAYIKLETTSGHAGWFKMKNIIIRVDGDFPVVVLEA